MQVFGQLNLELRISSPERPLVGYDARERAASWRLQVKGNEGRRNCLKLVTSYLHGAIAGLIFAVV